MNENEELLNPITKIFPTACAALLAVACTTVVYQGPELPDSAVAIIRSENTAIFAIDGKEVPYSGGNLAKFKVLPGTHTIRVLLNDRAYYRVSGGRLDVVFTAEAGKTYVTWPRYIGDRWQPAITENSLRRPPAVLPEVNFRRGVVPN